MRKLNAYDLKSFYNDFKGRLIRSIIRSKILNRWPDTKSKKIMGYGYTLPYLRPFMAESDVLFNMMPRQLGAHYWPAEKTNQVCLSEEYHLPLETNSVDLILMVHGLEFIDDAEETFEEMWRILKSTGRILIVVPNRLGFWARADWSPFGQGQPYSVRQVENLLTDNLFVHEHTSHALFSPPFQNSFFLRSAHFFEKIGAYLYPALGGVSIIEASKQLYAGKGTRAPAHQKLKIKKSVATEPVATPRIKID